MKKKKKCKPVQTESIGSFDAKRSESRTEWASWVHGPSGERAAHEDVSSDDATNNKGDEETLAGFLKKKWNEMKWNEI